MGSPYAGLPRMRPRVPRQDAADGTRRGTGQRLFLRQRCCSHAPFSENVSPLWTWLSSHGGERGQQSWGRRVVSTGGGARSHPCLRLLTASLLRPPWVLGQQAAALPKASPRHRPEWGVGTLAAGGRDRPGPENSSDFTALLPGGLAKCAEVLSLSEAKR